MHVHFLQHVSFETPGVLLPLLKEQAQEISFTHFFRNEPLPQIDAIDFLVIMGGPMSVHDEQQFSWLRDEKAFIEKAIAQGKTVLGICLGAQLIADVLGAKVFKNQHREIGWFQVYRAPEIGKSKLGSIWPQEVMAFHWHGEMFEIPAGAMRMAHSQACDNQGFVFEERVVGLQFHLEITPKVIDGLLTHCADELDGSTFVQSADEIREKMNLCQPAHELMAKVVQRLLQKGD